MVNIVVVEKREELKTNHFIRKKNQQPIFLFRLFRSST